jgi:hypothetical protein
MSKAGISVSQTSLVADCFDIIELLPIMYCMLLFFFSEKWGSVTGVKCWLVEGKFHPRI